MRSLGCKIGERVVFFAPDTCEIDVTRPWLLEIGDDVQIPFGVSILTHGYDWSVLKGAYGEVLGSAGKVTIGNNVFIGARSTLLKGVTVGNNVIIGAGSLVTKDIPDNSVAAGVPCNVRMSLEEYCQKRRGQQYSEATQLVQEYRLCYGKEPSEKELSEFFFLFSNDPAELDESWERQMHNLGNYEKSFSVFKTHTPMFPSMEAFLASVPKKTEQSGDAPEISADR